jgi:hypothetical protein
MSISRTVESPLAAEGYRSFRLATVSTCVEAMGCKSAPDLEAIEVDISPIVSLLTEISGVFIDAQALDQPFFHDLGQTRFYRPPLQGIKDFLEALL